MCPVPCVIPSSEVTQTLYWWLTFYFAPGLFSTCCRFEPRATDWAPRSVWVRALLGHNSLSQWEREGFARRIENTWVWFSCLFTSVPASTLLWFSDAGQDWWFFFAPHHKHRTHLLSGWQAHSSFCCSIPLQHNMEGRAVGWWAGGSAACIWILGFGYY